MKEQRRAGHGEQAQHTRRQSQGSLQVRSGGTKLAPPAPASVVLDPGQGWGCAGTSLGSSKSLRSSVQIREGFPHFILIHASFVLKVTAVFILGSVGLCPRQGDSSREQKPPRRDMSTREVRMSPSRCQRYRPPPGAHTIRQVAAICVDHWRKGSCSLCTPPPFSPEKPTCSTTQGGRGLSS